MDYNELKLAVEKELADVKTPQELRDFSHKYLGKKGAIRGLFSELKNLDDDEKRKAGQEINRFANECEIRVKELEKGFIEDSRKSSLQDDVEELEINPPKIGHLHPITETINEMNKIFLSMGYSIVDGPEIETDEFCFQRLNVPSDHPARGMQDTIYLKEPNIMLRTQMSSVESRTLANYKPPFKVVTPGRVYRNEKANKSNHFIFHHYQGVVVLERVSLKDLFSTLNLVFKKMYGFNVNVRYRNKYYPEVEPGVGPDMQCFQCKGKGCPLCKGVGWIEMGGAGIIHPNVMKMAGIDTAKWMGFAFGLGLDRWVMAKYNITDIRTLLGGNLGYKYHENEGNL
ncbi:MAG TPA: phenylalanine--tRNA ligase subunit alpha [Candidatus Paceibacterota bacterium]|nr:phenylalanine--tRNA ligase subunit alpha [Candidatus Pacearchaeota archaeon]HRZ51406.1 phenylalanine--tRNA ligase subunit alpha [Candidatus Paceibacterota bacterium]HSA37128.1 phenylalanine--tRNA ligase subunit alpha [Candidatus Paceibacterota bacterium]